MRLHELLQRTQSYFKDMGLDPEGELIPTRDITGDGNSLLFYLTPTKKPDEVTQINTDCYAVVCDSNAKIKTERPIIKVENAREAFAKACSRYYKIDYEKLKIIGITGTNGKTTTATLIYKMLCYDGKRAGFVGTGLIEICGNRITDANYSMTTPDPETLYMALGRMQEEGCEYVVMEVSSHSLALDKVSPIKFEMGLFTNLSQDHLDFHNTTEEYFKAKSRLFLNCKKAIYNNDDKYARLAKEISPCPAIGVGIIEKDDVYATDIEINGIFGSTYFYRQEGLIFRVTTELPGCFNVYNTLMALSCVIELGMRPCIAKKALFEIKTIDGRMEKYITDLTVFIDYAHTPVAFENALISVNTGKIQRQNTICVFGCGGERDKEKRAMMAKSAAKHSQLIYITEDNSRSEDFYSIVSDIESGLPKGTDYRIIEKRECAIITAITEAHPGDRIAILGKGREEYIIDNNGKRTYSERDVVKKALLKRSEKTNNEGKA